MLPIDVMMMARGSTEGLVDLVDFSDSDLETSPGPASSGFSIRSDGNIYTISPPPSGPVQQWLLSGNASDYEVKVVPTFGTFSSGNTGLWENLGTNRNWSLVRTTPGESETNALVYIKLASSSTILAQALFSLSSTIEF